MLYFHPFLGMGKRQGGFVEREGHMSGEDTTETGAGAGAEKDPALGETPEITSSGIKGRPQIPPADREVLEKYLGPLPDDEALRGRTEDAGRPDGEGVERRGTERRDPYTGLTDGELLKLPWDEVEAYHKLPDKTGYLSIRILDQMGRQMWVYWPKDENEARKKVRNIIGEIELSREDVGKQLSLEKDRIESVLKSIERLPDKEEYKEFKQSSKKLDYELKAREKFHVAFYQYEHSSSIEAITKAATDMLTVEEKEKNFFNTIFEIEERIDKPDGSPEFVNPFVEALQYYEDHGHEFARNNSQANAPYFAKKVQRYLAAREACIKLGLKPDELPTRVESFDSYKQKPENRDKTYNDYQLFTEQEQEKLYKQFIESKGGKYENFISIVDSRYKEYAWAQNMAVRLFRFSGRGEMHDYLVINKGKEGERAVHWDYEGPESVSWASGGEGCDYDIRKNSRFREYLRQEGGLLRSHIELLDGVDIFGGDFWSRTIRPKDKDFLTYDKSNIRKPVQGKDGSFPYYDRQPSRNYNDKGERIKLVDGKEEKMEPWEIKEEDERLRMDDDNYGERVGHLNFRLLQRKFKDGKLESGFSFDDMGVTPMGLWAVRFVGAPENAKKALSGEPDAFLLNPNFESLGKLLNAFDATKAEAWETKKHLLRNFIKYARSEKIEGTGKEKYTEDEILAGVNKLTGLTDQNGVQFVQLPERAAILREFFNIKISEKDEEKINKLVEKKCGTKTEVNTARFDFEEAKEINKKLNFLVDKRLNRKFMNLFIIGFLMGLTKEFIQSLIKELGIK